MLWRIEAGALIASILALTSLLIALIICFSDFTSPACNLAFLWSQRWYTVAHRAILQRVTLKLPPLRFFIPHSSSRSQSSGAEETRHKAIMYFQILFEKKHLKNKWFLSSMYCLQNWHIGSTLIPQSNNLSLVDSLSLIANHPIKQCLGIASRNQTSFHQGTSICLLLRCCHVAAQLKILAAVRAQTTLSLSLIWTRLNFL